jgi:hypothetical protein
MRGDSRYHIHQSVCMCTAAGTRTLLFAEPIYTFTYTHRESFRYSIAASSCVYVGMPLRHFGVCFSLEEMDQGT